MQIKKAVIPIAGKGTRFLPATKEVPKEILPILNRPMIEYVVKEAVDAGIEQIIFVTSSGKEAVENHFDRNIELESFLESKGKMDELSYVRKLGSMIDIVSVRQKEQLGLGHALLQAAPVIGQERFVVLLGDDLILSATPAIEQLMKVSDQHEQASVIGVMRVPKEETNKYGIVAGEMLSDDPKTMKMTCMVEKPSVDQAPSDLATPGRYVLDGAIFDILRQIPKGAGGEYQLTDAINILCEKQAVYAHLFEGDRFDTGNIKGHLNATLEFALRDDQLKEYMIKLMEEKLRIWK